ncbi:hypothetical protein CEK29_11010 [Bordetella genomosp. 5]|uniref:Uncharacterized protein n=1 Tax=Bordetella genomosp. 5 TaxID=1395608 RepID=A0A261TQ95_9BORD|nr:hypothetical protein [Bordetella genomosp. 5]OZI43663.1 hypothetical protein CEK29_11010 [Bordetella genomosp. 5]OZI51828.1 hypothetical protein CAL25_09900 [Bordetella genomosp. 5]
MSQEFVLVKTLYPPKSLATLQEDLDATVDDYADLAEALFPSLDWDETDDADQTGGEIDLDEDDSDTLAETAHIEMPGLSIEVRADEGALVLAVQGEGEALQSLARGVAHAAAAQGYAMIDVERNVLVASDTPDLTYTAWRKQAG